MKISIPFLITLIVGASVLVYLVFVAMYLKKSEETNAFCGGIAGITCPSNQSCVLDGSHPDAGGICVVKGQVDDVLSNPLVVFE